MHLRQRLRHRSACGHPGRTRSGSTQGLAQMRHYLRLLPAADQTHDRARPFNGAPHMNTSVRAPRPGGKVWLIGAGPGDAELLTLKAARVLRSCSIWLVDDLVG